MCKIGQTCRIRAISECSPLLAAGSQKRCVKGPQRWLEAFVPLQSGPAISAAVGEVSVGLIWWPSHPSINEDNGVQGGPAMQGAYVLAQWAFQPTNQHTSSKLSNPATKIPAANLCLPFSGSQRTPDTAELLATVMVLHLNVFDRRDDDDESG